MKQIGEVIALRRKDRKLSQKEIAGLLEGRGIVISNAGISAWEKGSSKMTAEALLALCEILQINDIYTEFIGENPADPFRNLNEEGKLKALDYIGLLEKSREYEAVPSAVTDITPRIMRIAIPRASAGTGNFLDDENFDEAEIYDPVPAKADFGVYVDGDSMEPRLKDGELVWIEQTESLEPGDIGLFFLDGRTYIKKYVVNRNGTFLVSLNANYRPIEVGEFSSFRIFGRLTV
ncbi:MAG: LexA family transcriptional regulator [Lachnospiraceae bacterium]|nr:LexA family transcriptional regulator [Lachnospiraceae bacterium]